MTQMMTARKLTKNEMQAIQGGGLASSPMSIKSPDVVVLWQANRIIDVDDCPEGYRSR